MILTNLVKSDCSCCCLILQVSDKPLQSFPCCMEESWKICLRQTKYKRIRFCLIDGKAWNRMQVNESVPCNVNQGANS